MKKVVMLFCICLVTRMCFADIIRVDERLIINTNAFCYAKNTKFGLTAIYFSIGGREETEYLQGDKVDSIMLAIKKHQESKKKKCVCGNKK